jgi:hypothetical protein
MHFTAGRSLWTWNISQTSQILKSSRYIIMNLWQVDSKRTRIFFSVHFLERHKLSYECPREAKAHSDLVAQLVCLIALGGRATYRVHFLPLTDRNAFWADAIIKRFCEALAHRAQANYLGRAGFKTVAQGSQIFAERNCLWIFWQDICAHGQLADFFCQGAALLNVIAKG